MHPTPRLLVLAAAVLASFSRLASAATPEEDFVAAENTFRFQDYPAARRMLESLLYPEVRLSDPDQVLKAREYLGAACFWMKDERRMEEEFTAILTRAPTYRMDPFYYPFALIERFDGQRKRLVDLHIITLEAPHPPAEGPRCERQEETIVQRSRVVSFLPFGIGQFQNGDSTKGALFLTGEAIGLGLNIGAWAAAEALRGANGYYSADDATRARNLRVVQYAGLGLLVGLMVWDVVDSALNFVPEDRKVDLVPCPPPPGRGLNGATSRDVSGSLCLRFN